MELLQMINLKLFKSVFLGLSIVAFVLTAYYSFAVINIGVSLKYEVDQSRTISEIKGINDFKEIDELEKKLITKQERAKRNIKISLVVFLIAFVGYVFLSLIQKQRRKSHRITQK